MVWGNVPDRGYGWGGGAILQDQGQSCTRFSFGWFVHCDDGHSVLVGRELVNQKMTSKTISNTVLIVLGLLVVAYLMWFRTEPKRNPGPAPNLVSDYECGMLLKFPDLDAESIAKMQSCRASGQWARIEADLARIEAKEREEEIRERDKETDRALGRGGK